MAATSASARIEDHRRLQRCGARPLPRPRHQCASFGHAGLGAHATAEDRCASRGDPARTRRTQPISLPCTAGEGGGGTTTIALPCTAGEGREGGGTTTISLPCTAGE